ncbi:unnamed protein product [Sphagnum troendelagicum]|uniref:Peptidase A2 domain-containing protein n=1 Tax=Sphagnum troendelagicum TaxID=128251 RepID=A0ABP0UEZ7_9BRYO
MPQSFHLLNMEEERTLLAKGEETITPQVVRASNSRVPRVHIHQKNTQFSTDQLMECQLQMHEVVQKLVSTPLFSFQDLKLSTRDIIAILDDTLNTTSSPLPIPEPHAIEVPSNTLERHSIGSHVADDVRNLVISSSMAKLVGFPISDSTITYQKGVQNTSLVDLLLSKDVVDSHSLHKVSHSFSKVVLSDKTSITTRVAIVDNTGLAIQVGGHTPRVVLLDTGAEPVIFGVQFAKNMGMLDSKLRKSMCQIHTASGSVKEETDGHHLGYIPLDLHGNHSPVAHHYMLKEAHTISYIQQASHERIEGDEEEIAYAQAIENLRVIPTDIQHGPEVLQRFKVAHKPLVKALSNFESMESHGEPIKPLFHQPITWTPPKEGITLLELFGGIVTGIEALLQSGMVVRRYFYADIDLITRQVAA